MTNWQTKKLSEWNVQVIDGDRGKNYPNQSELKSSGDCLFLSANNVTKNGFRFYENVFIDERKDSTLGKGKLARGDIIITTRGTVGNVAHYTDTVSYPSIRINSGMAIIRNSEKASLTTPYLLHYLLSPMHRKETDRVVFGSAQPQLTIATINKFPISAPEASEQERIVSVLEVWDEYIHKLEQKIALKEQLKKGLMQQLLTGKRRLPRFNGEWIKFRLKDVASIRKGTQLNRDTLSDTRTGLNAHPVINGGILPSGYTDASNTRSGAITVSEGGNSCGYVNYIKEDFWLGGHCYEITNSLKVDQIYLYPLLKANQPRIMSLRVGSGLPNIQKNSLESLSLLVPLDKEEQEVIGLIMLHSVTEIEQLEEKLTELRLQKKYLLKNLITGTIRTPEDLKPLVQSEVKS